METRIMKILSKNGSVPLKLIYGHFATNHSHINCYLDMTTLKTRQSEAELAAQALVQHYVATTIVDTILCLDGIQIKWLREPDRDLVAMWREIEPVLFPEAIWGPID